MSSSKRDRLRREIFDTVPVERLVAVAVLMMRWQRTDLPLDADLARFMASLNVRELRRLARTGSRTSGRIDR